MGNVFLTGGNMQYPGMKERVERELLAMRPFQSHFKVPHPFFFQNVIHHLTEQAVLNDGSLHRLRGEPIETELVSCSIANTQHTFKPLNIKTKPKTEASRTLNCDVTSVVRQNLKLPVVTVTSR